MCRRIKHQMRRRISNDRICNSMPGGSRNHLHLERWVGRGIHEERVIMSENEKHALRCETCYYYKLRPTVDECMVCNHPKFKGDVFMHEICGIEFDRIEKMGCASHSSVVTDTTTPTHRITTDEN
jgi:hypothetical protein